MPSVAESSWRPLTIVKAVLLATVLLEADGVIIKENKVTLQVAIETAPKHYAKRDMVRSTWMRHPQVLAGHVNVKFFAGWSNSNEVMQNLTAEQSRHGDLVMLDVEDSYVELRLKTLAILRWFGTSPTADFLLKTDDDTYPRLSRIMLKLQEAKGEKYAYLGYFHQRVPLAAPINSKREPWKRPNHTVYSWMTYPDFASGQGYILSKELVAEIGYRRHDKALHNLVFPHEDISVGYWVLLFEERMQGQEDAMDYHRQVQALKVQIASYKKVKPSSTNGSPTSVEQLKTRLRDLHKEHRESQKPHKPNVKRVNLPTTQFGCRETDLFSGNREPEDLACMWKKEQRNETHLCCGSSRKGRLVGGITDAFRNMGLPS